MIECAEGGLSEADDPLAVSRRNNFDGSPDPASVESALDDPFQAWAVPGLEQCATSTLLKPSGCLGCM